MGIGLILSPAFAIMMLDCETGHSQGLVHPAPSYCSPAEPSGNTHQTFGTLRGNSRRDLLIRSSIRPLSASLEASDETPAKMLEVEMLVMTVGGKERSPEDLGICGLPLSRIVPTPRPLRG
jgi:hypothetical protein